MKFNEREISTEAEMDKVLPAEFAGYFADTEKKHFDPEEGAGSLFTEVKDLRSLLEMAISQRGSLDGDDRDKFIEMGVDKDALLPICRYLKVDTKGETGIEKVTDLDPQAKVKVVRTKQGAPCSLIVESNDFAPAEFGTVIIGPNEKQKPDDPEPSTSEMLWTVHPGLPVRPTTEDNWPEGSEITVKEVMDYFSEKGVNLDTLYLNLKKI